MKSSCHTSAIDVFLSGILDYAGLFPPARLDLPTALGNFEFYQRHPQASMLARFVLPLEALGKCTLPNRVTLVCRGENVDLPTLPPEVEAIEIAGSLASVTDRQVFQEIDWRGDFEADMPVGVGVKLRTGGLTPDALPPAETVATYLSTAAQRDVPIKFTAGLHSPVAHEGGHGFFNIFAAAFAAYTDQGDIKDLTALLEETSWDAFHFEADAFCAGSFRFGSDEIARLRAERVISYGSCSFLEPVEHLEQHGYLQPQ